MTILYTNTYLLVSTMTVRNQEIMGHVTGRRDRRWAVSVWVTATDKKGY